MTCLELGGRRIADGQVPALQIIKHFEVFKYLLSGLRPCSVLTLTNQFSFEDMKGVRSLWSPVKAAVKVKKLGGKFDLGCQ